MMTERKPRVLVVDDEEVIADTYAVILNQHGLDAYAVYSGEAAVADAATFQPDCVVSDIMMGKLNGIDAALQIRRFLPGCHFVLMSGHPATTELLRHADARGHVFSVLAKPVHPQIILDQLQEVLDQTATIDQMKKKGTTSSLENVNQLGGMDGLRQKLKRAPITEGVIEEIGSCRVA